MNPTALHLALIGDYDPQVTLKGARVPLVTAWLMACQERSA